MRLVKLAMGALVMFMFSATSLFAQTGGGGPEEVVCGEIEGAWSCRDWESNGDCPFAGSCDSGNCAISETDNSIPMVGNFGSASPFSAPVKKLNPYLRYCGWKFYCLPYCEEVNGTDRCLNFFYVPLGGVDYVESGPCPQPPAP